MTAGLCGFLGIEMAENMSLADQAVQAIAMVKDMDKGVDNEHPERHVVRSMKRVAEQALAAAFRNAIDVAWMAKDLQETARKLEASAKPHNAIAQGREHSERPAGAEG